MKWDNNSAVIINFSGEEKINKIVDFLKDRYEIGYFDIVSNFSDGPVKTKKDMAGYLNIFEDDVKSMIDIHHPELLAVILPETLEEKEQYKKAEKKTYKMLRTIQGWGISVPAMIGLMFTAAGAVTMVL